MTPKNTPPGDYDEFAKQILSLKPKLDKVIEEAKAMGDLAEPTDATWYGELVNHLVPQLENPNPVLIVAVTGGTNTGKSTIFNHLVGAHVSGVKENATETKHPVCVLPQKLLTEEDVAEFFPDFSVERWANEEDPTRESDKAKLFVKHDPEGNQSKRLVLLDTPDIDGTFEENWDRANKIRASAHVLVCVLTMQKYADYKIRKFFREGMKAEKTLMVVFNYEDEPGRQKRCGNWLRSFEEDIQGRVHYSYAMPRDATAASKLELPFHPLSTQATDLRQDLADLKFDEIKLRSHQGSLKTILDQKDGLPTFLDKVKRRCKEYESARQTLQDKVKINEIKGMPPPPTHIIWDPIKKWFEPRRNPFERAINDTFNRLGRLVIDRFRPRPEKIEKDYRNEEEEFFNDAIMQLFGNLDLVRRGGNSILKEACTDVLAGSNRERLREELKKQQQELPLVQDHFSDFVFKRLDEFAEEHPTQLKWVTRALLATAIVRPVISIACVGVPVQEVATGIAAETALEVAKQAGTQAAIDLATEEVARHGATQVVIDVTLASATQVGSEAVGKAGVKKLLADLFREFCKNRMERLVEIIDQNTIAPMVKKLNRFADYPKNTSFCSLQETTMTLNDQCNAFRETK